MILRPRFAVGAFVFSHDHNRDASRPRQGRCVANAFGLRTRLGLLHVVLVPRCPSLFARCDLAAFGIHDLRVCPSALANAIENADLVSRSRVAAVTAQVNIRRIGPDHRNGLVLPNVQRKKIAFILEQHDRFLRHFQSQLLVLGAVGDALGVVRVHVRMVEQTETKLRGQHARCGLVDFSLRDFALAHLFDQRRVNGAIGEIEVYARGQRLARGVGLIGGDMMRFHQHLQTSAIRGHVAAEAPFLAQDPIQQPVVDMGWDAVNLVVGSHHTAHVSFFDGCAERHQESLAYFSLGIVRRSGIGSTLRLAVRGEMFRRGHHVMPVDRSHRTLQSVDGRHSHARNQIWIFSVSLFRSSPTRISRQVEHGRECLAHSGRSHFVAGGIERLLHQLRIPGAGQPQHLRKAGAPVSHESMQGLALKICRDAEAGFRRQIVLCGVARLGSIVRRNLRILAVELRQLLEDLLGFGVFFGARAAASAGQLIDFFFERHALEKIRYAHVNWQGRVFVCGTRLLGQTRS